MKFDTRIEAELVRQFDRVQLDEEVIRNTPGRANDVLTRSPFVNSTTLSTQYFVAYQGPDEAPLRPITRGGLSAWQVRRAKQMMAVQRRPALSIAEVANACGVSESHFVREFKQSTGMTPHHWAMTQRVATAKDLLLHTRLSLERVAAGSGFFDPSHLSRWFKRLTGDSPRSWQRMQAVERVG